MQIVKIDDRCRPELDASDFIRGRPRARVVPWTDDKKVFRPYFR